MQTPKPDPWHSLTQNVHHVHAECAAAKAAERFPGSRREGHGDKPPCPECIALGSHATPNVLPSDGGKRLPG